MSEIRESEGWTVVVAAYCARCRMRQKVLRCNDPPVCVQVDVVRWLMRGGCCEGHGITVETMTPEEFKEEQTE